MKLNNDLAAIKETLQSFSEIIASNCTKRNREKSDRELKIIFLESEVQRANTAISRLKELFGTASETAKAKEPAKAQESSQNSPQAEAKAAYKGLANEFELPKLNTDSRLLSPDLNRSDGNLTWKISSNLKQVTSMKRKRKQANSRSFTNNPREIKGYFKYPKTKMKGIIVIDKLKSTQY